MKRFPYGFSIFFVLISMITMNQSRLFAQETTEPASETAVAPDEAGETAKPSLSEKWDRLIYVPFKELQKVFDNQDASVVLPYAEYLDLMKRALAAVLQQRHYA